MYKTLKSLPWFTGCVLSVFMLGQASAFASVAGNLVGFSQPSYAVAAGDTLTVSLVGSNFDVAPDAAAFSLSWDKAVLTYISASMANTLWNSLGSGSFVSTEHTDLGSLDYVFLTMDNGDAGNDFSLGTFTFQVNNDAELGASDLVVNIDSFNLGFYRGLNPVNANYVNSQIQVVPLPSAVWLFGTVLLGLCNPGLKRRWLKTVA